MQGRGKTCGDPGENLTNYVNAAMQYSALFSAVKNNIFQMKKKCDILFIFRSKHRLWVRVKSSNCYFFFI